MSSNEARVARDHGIQTAGEHADRISPDWQERAYLALVDFARRTPSFTVEQLRAAVADTLEEPPSLRAWGGIVRRAAHARIVEKMGYVEAEAENVHCNLVTVWRSCIYSIGRLTEESVRELTGAATLSTRQQEMMQRAEAAGIAAYYTCKTFATDNKIRSAVRAAIATLPGYRS